MYKIVTVEDKVRVQPTLFGKSTEEAVKASIERTWEGVVDKDVGVILSVVSVDKVGEGKILPGDGSIYFPSEFKLLVYAPENHELVKGIVIDVTEFGVFARTGPLDGMIHVSQIMDDFVSYDAKGSMFVGRESKRTVKEGDEVLARIISVSLEKQYKIGLTTRQQGLGVDSWRKLPPVRRGAGRRQKGRRREEA